MLENLKKSIEELQNLKEFKDFKKKNSDAYLASCVMIIDEKKVGDWQVDFYIPKKHKLMTFLLKEPVECKGEDNIFQKEKTPIKELKLENIGINIEKALDILEDLRKKSYKGDFPNKTIAVLQIVDDKPVWNLTLLTTTLKVLNVKLDAVTGKIISEKIENFLQFKAS